MVKSILSRRGMAAVEQIVLDVPVGALKRAFREYTLTRGIDVRQAGEEWVVFWHALIVREGVVGNIKMNLGNVKTEDESEQEDNHREAERTGRRTQRGRDERERGEGEPEDTPKPPRGAAD